MNPVDLTLYLVTDSSYHTEASFLKTVEEACQGGVTLVQLREKSGGRDYLDLALRVKEITDHYRIPLIIDDRVDVALACGAAGVHVGQSDLPVACARKLMGPDKIVGATAKTVSQALDAYEQGADYLGLGAVFSTSTKTDADTMSYETLKAICNAVKIPTVAIGGISASNIMKLKGSGVDGVAVVSAIFGAPDPGSATARLAELARQMIAG